MKNSQPGLAQYSIRSNHRCLAGKVSCLKKTSSSALSSAFGGTLSTVLSGTLSTILSGT